MSLTPHTLMVVTDVSGDQFTVRIIHRPTGLSATSDTLGHRNDARAQALERLEALLTEDTGSAA